MWVPSSRLGLKNPIKIGANAVRQELSHYLIVRGNIEANTNHNVSYYLVKLESKA